MVIANQVDRTFLKSSCTAERPTPCQGGRTKRRTVTNEKSPYNRQEQHLKRSDLVTQLERRFSSFQSNSFIQFPSTGDLQEKVGKKFTRTAWEWSLCVQIVDEQNFSVLETSFAYSLIDLVSRGRDDISGRFVPAQLFELKVAALENALWEVLSDLECIGGVRMAEEKILNVLSGKRDENRTSVQGYCLTYAK